MTFQFRPAKRSNSKPLIGLYAESGCGKTWSALLLARGFVGPQGRIGMIETEGGRGEANVGRDPVGDYLVCPITGDFSPKSYGAAITAAESANLDALIIDSASHEWEGAGGVLSMAADNQAAGKKGVLVWQQPKIEHSRNFMLRLMQTPIPLVIVCMRAKYPMQQVKGEWARSTVLEPKQADDILFEMFVHGWIDQDHKLHVTKYTIPDVAAVIPDGKAITLETGKNLAQWTKGNSELPRRLEPGEVNAAAPVTPPSPQPQAGAADVNEDLMAWDSKLASAANLGVDALREVWGQVPKPLKKSLEAALRNRHQPTAEKVPA
jgi:hypothetical protein